jgi:hypothetical protein
MIQTLPKPMSFIVGWIEATRPNKLKALLGFVPGPSRRATSDEPAVYSLADSAIAACI